MQLALVRAFGANMFNSPMASTSTLKACASIPPLLGRSGHVSLCRARDAAAPSLHNLRKCTNIAQIKKWKLNLGRFS
jgi:hypothetical protein